VDAHLASAETVCAEFAFVPIKLSAGYEFNSLLQEISARSTDPDALVEFAKARRESALALIEGTGGEGDTAGALVVFRTGTAAAPLVADNVVSIAEAAGSEEARTQLERARRDAEEARVELRNLQGQLEEARRESQRARNEADVARQEANDSRDELIVAQRGAEEARRHVEDARRAGDELRAASEDARIRSEEAQREADSLREQLREARDSVRGLAGRADDELAHAQERAALAVRELAEARAETARHQAEVAPLRERYQQAQREVGALRADLESARAAATERETLGERRAGELERARTELEARMTEVAELREALEHARAEAASLNHALEHAHAEAASLAALEAPTAVSPDPEMIAVRERLERMRLAFDRAPVATALIAPDGRYIEVSDTLCETLGHGREQLLSGTPPAIVHPDDADAHRDLARRLLAGEQASSRGHRRYVHADGHALAMRESVTLVRDGEGRPTMFVLQMEEAHEHGGRQVVVDADVAADEPQPERTSTALSTDIMRRALEDDLFELHCQPVLDLRTNSVSQYELLIRMRGEDGRLILPEAFLGPARRAGLAHSIDRWVVHQAIRLLGEMPSDVSLEVNLSPEAVHDADLATMVEQELAASPVDPGRLVLEVTGATAADHLEETRELAKRLRGLGCRFALDDFRSNFGSFRLLRDLPLDYLKLDGELVSSLTESRTSQLIVKALVDVAAGTGMKTIAVFVSDDETVQVLRQLGVGYAQGYSVGRPQPVSEALQAGAPRLPPG
jgi:PAS domain S-box-containing protein